ncbi:zinc finger, CCHC-type containing protein [Tanacetum coccineum]
MAGNTVKEMTTNFGKLVNFEGHDFRRWQKKMHFLLTTLKVVYVLTTRMPEWLEDATVQAIRIRAKWKNDDYICMGHILNGMSDSLFDVYTNVESTKELWDSLESKYMADDSSSKKFLVSNFNNYKMVDSRPVMKDFKHTLKHGKDDLSLVQLGSHLRIEESLRAQDSDKGKGKEVVGSSVNMAEEGKNKNNKQNKGKKRDFKEHDSGSGSNKKPKLECWKCGKTGHFKRDCHSAFYVQVDAITWWIDSGATTHVCKDRLWFKTYEPVEDGSVLYMGDMCTDNAKITRNGQTGQTRTRERIECTKAGNLIARKVKRIIHETTAPYTPQQNGVAERKNRALKEMVNSMLSYSGLSEGFWGEAMLTACYLLNRVPNKRNKTTPYELWYKKRPNLSFLRVWGCRAVVRLPDPKRKTLGKKGIDCIFVGYAEHSKAYRFYVIEPNDSVSINSIIESRDAIFDENRFSSIPRPKDIIPNSDESQRDDHSDGVPSEIPEPRKGKRVRKAKSYGSDFQLYLVEGSRDQKEAIDDEIGSIMENNTWVLSDLPPGCKPLGCKWIFKRKMKVDGTIDKFKARLVIQGFRQKEGIDYFDTYAPVARITTIRLLLALAAIHNLVIHQMDVKTAFLNGDLDEEVYMKQPEGFVMPGNEHKVCKLVKSLYGLKQAPKQWHQKFDEVVLSSGFLLNHPTSVYIAKLYPPVKFSMKDMGEADVILGIKIKRENKGIVITQSHYIEKILKKFNREDCSPVSTPMDPVEKLKPNTGKPVDQLEYSRAIGCLMYAMTSTRPDIAYAVGRLSRFTSNPSRQHGSKQCVQVLESWINHVEDSSSTSGWVFLLGGGAISWASKKQTCITGSTMESEFVALAAAGKEAEWLRNLIHEIPIWPKPIAPISIRCDSAPIMAKAYSQIYNGKSRHLGVRHSMIRELIMNGVISIEFVRSQKNLADHLTKGLARVSDRDGIKVQGLQDYLCKHEVLPLQEAWTWLPICSLRIGNMAWKV